MLGYLAEFKARWKKRGLGAEIRTSTACPAAHMGTVMLRLSKVLGAGSCPPPGCGGDISVEIRSPRSPPVPGSELAPNKRQEIRHGLVPC